MGAFGLIIFFALPFLYIKYKNEKVYTIIHKKEKFLILFYISSFVLISSLFGSIYPATNDLLKTLNLVGEAAFILSLPTIIMTIALDNLIKKLSNYLSLEKGLLDPITDEKNIALRDETFFEIINAIEEARISEVAKKIGEDYTKIVLKQYSHIDNFNDFKNKWVETDSKAGFFETIEIDDYGVVHIVSSISIKENIDKIHQFIKCYYTSIIKTYYREAKGTPKDVELISSSTNTKLSFQIKDYF